MNRSHRICRKSLPWKLVFHSRRCQIILLSYIQYRCSRIFNIRARNALPRRIEQDCTDRRIREISQHLFDGEFNSILPPYRQQPSSPGPLSHSGPLKPEHRSGGKNVGRNACLRSLLRHAFRPYSRFLGGGVTAAFALQAARQ